MKTSKSIFSLGIAIILSVVTLTASAQADYVTVTGIVKDAKSKDAVQFASISLVNTTIGTIANSEGEFILKVPTAQQNNPIEISHIGYANKSFDIDAQSTSGKEQVYLLDPHNLSISEIVVRPESPEMLVKMAIENVGKNYAKTPCMMEGFYRETIKQNRDYVGIAEAVVDIYKTSYIGYENDRVKIDKGRKATNVKKADTLLVKLQGGPIVALLLDVVKNPDYLFELNALNDYKYTLTSIISIDNKMNYVVSFEPAVVRDYPLFNGKFYINQETLALTAAEFSLDLSDRKKAEAFFVKKKPAGLTMYPVSTSYLISYKQQADKKYAVNYVRNEMKFKADWKKRWFKTNYTIMSEMAITDISNANVTKIPNAEQFRTSMVLNDKIQDLNDENFWGSSNIIEPEQSIQSAIKKIARYMQKHQE